MLKNKILFSSQVSLFLILSTATIAPLFADTSEPEAVMTAEEVEKATSGLAQTLDYNFSPEDRARLRKALADYARNNDPEHIQIERRRKIMKQSLKARFTRCNNDLDDSLDRQEVTACLPQVARHFGAVDVDEDNVITFGELELAEAKWTERHKAADAKLEAKRIKEAEAKIKDKAAQPKKSKQAASKKRHPS
ncbi:MAG: hypothetical protein ACKE5M_02260 [Methylophilaceae bacterium]